MSVKRVLRSAVKSGIANGTIQSAASQLQSSQAEIPERKATTKKKPKADNEDHSELVENRPAKRAKNATRRSLRSPVTTAVVENKETHPATTSHNRLAHPHMTNAPLRVPGDSGLITCSKDITQVSQSQDTTISPPFTTTEDLLKQACDHLINVDARLKPLIEKHPCPLFSAKGLAEEIDPFEYLCSGIMSQQISGAAAASVKRKFVGIIYPESLDQNLHSAKQFPSPQQVAACDISSLRGAGLSQRKAEYIKGLAEQFASGVLSNDILFNASDEEVLERLTAVRGLGKWSVEMFSCFGLKRMDVFSTGDLGVQYDSLLLHSSSMRV